MHKKHALGVLLVWAVSVLPAAGLACQTSADCDDGNPCTEDLCDTTLGCVYSDLNTSCNDGNACSTNDVCNGGTCVGGAIASGCTSCQAIADVPADGGTFVGATSGTGTMSSSCGSTGPSPERVYRWTPSASGAAIIQTCGSGTLYDSVVHVHAATCGGAELACNDDTAGCTTGEPNDHHGSRIAINVTAGQTYVIAVDGYNGARGTYSLTITPPSLCGNGLREGAEACDGADTAGCPSGECTASCTCVPPAGGLPDLAPAIADVSVAFNTSVDNGDVVEGCAEATSGIDLLRFGAYSRNLGTADFVLGDPMCPSPCTDHPLEVCGDPDFICSPAAGHNHAHYNNYARYELLDGSGQTVVVGHKQGYCLRDTDCPNPVYTCENQGVTAGCSDLYGSNLGCQYLDITGIPSGNYVLRVTIDPFDRIVELSESNNVAQRAVTITRPGATPTRTPTRTPTPTAVGTPTGATATAATVTPVATPTPIAGCNISAIIPATGGTVAGTTTGQSSQAATCAWTGSAPEKLYQWTPASSGLATIGTCGTASLYDTVLYVRGDSCTGQEVACNDDTSGCVTGEPNDHHGSSVTLSVTAGRTYVIVVDGYGGASGTFSLSVVPPAGAPASATATPAPSATVTATPGAPSATPTATPTSIDATVTATAIETTATPTPGEPSATPTTVPASATPTETAPAETPTVAAPTATPLSSATATATPVASVTGTPVATATATTTPVPTATAIPTSTRTATPASTTTRTATPVPTTTRTPTPLSTTTLAATPARTATPAPTTTPSGVGGCAGATTIPSEGGTFTGVTSGSGTLGASCSYSVPSPENVYRWVAPRTGTLLLETCGSVTNFDTIVYVRAPSCDYGPEKACNDDTAGCGTGEPNDHHGSRVSAPVTAGTTYFIVVDGYAGARGTYQLRVTPP